MSELPFKKTSGTVSVGGGVWVVFLSIFLALFSGCTSPRLERQISEIPLGPAYQPGNVYAASDFPVDVRRVVVLPVYLPEGGSADRMNITDIVLSELRQAGRFEVVELQETTMLSVVGRRQLSSQRPFPEALLDYVREEFGADAILQTDLTQYRPYRPFVVGVRSRLFRVDTGAALWAIDEVFDAGSERVVTGARRYSLEEAHQRYPYTDSYSALRGPTHFTNFVMHTIFRTLPGMTPR